MLEEEVAVTFAPKRSVQVWKLATYLGVAVAALSGLGLAWLRFGPAVLDPANVSWFRGDSVWHFLVWNFFRFERWHLQPGHVANMMTPLGTSVGSGDALPLFAFPFKLLSPLLPANFQYFGLWLFACYALQAVFGYLLASVFVRGPRALLVGLFFLVAPVMVFRAGHIALSAHWLILMALWHYFAASRAERLELRPYRATWALNIGLAGLIHPYLAGMVFPIAFASLARETFHSRRLKPLSALLLLASLVTLLLGLWWVSGVLGGGQNPRSWGFNYFTMNLLAPINPQGHSRVLPALPIRDGQYEGFAFLGTGVLALGLFTLVRRRVVLGRALLRLPLMLYRRGHLTLSVFGLLFFAYAVGDGLAFGEFVTPNYSVFKNFPALISAFRAPGRFFWPTYYLIYLALFVFLVRTFPSRQATLLLLGGLTLQFADLKLNQPFVSGQVNFLSHLRDERWPELMASFSRVVVTPAFNRDTADRNDFVDFSFLASRGGTELTTGMTARPHLKQPQTRLALQRQALSGPRGTDALYVFSSLTFAEKFYEDLEPGFRCYPLNAYLTCHNSERELGLGEPVDTATFVPRGYERFTLTEFVNHYQDQTVVIAVRGALGLYALDLNAYLYGLGSRINDIGVLQGSYLAVLDRGRLVFEDLSYDEPVSHDWTAGTVIGSGETALELPRDLYVYSAGIPDQKVASVATDSEVHNASTLGVSVTVLDDDFRIVRRADFGTLVTDTAVLERPARASANTHRAEVGSAP